VRNSRPRLPAVDCESRTAALLAQPCPMTTNDNTGAASPRRDDQRPAGVARHQDDGLTRVKASTPDALLALVPHLLGFYPSLSLVVLGLGGRRHMVRVTFRYDLPDPADSALAADLAEHAASVLRRQRLDLAALVGYGPAGLVVPVLATAVDCLTAEGVRLAEVLRADAGRYWSVLCDDPDCCPAEGRPFDPGSHPLAAAMTGAGMPALPDRATLARTLLPPAGSTGRIRRATRLAEERLCELGSRHWADGGRDLQLLTARTGHAALRSAIRQYRNGGIITSADDLAWLAVLLADLRVRDDAWARMVPAHREAHRRLWTDVVKGAAREYVPAPAALLAFTAWQSGNGALAAVAVDRALAAKPGYSMALLIGEALHAGLPPSAAKLPMTPAQVAASYAAQQARQGGLEQTAPRTGGRRGPSKPPQTAARQPKAGSGRQPERARSRAAGTASGATTSGASRRPSG
jgi:hypothetical protein